MALTNHQPRDVVYIGYILSWLPAAVAHVVCCLQTLRQYQAGAGPYVTEYLKSVEGNKYRSPAEASRERQVHVYTCIYVCVSMCTYAHIDTYMYVCVLVCVVYTCVYFICM